jgi:YHS domain-containing protein
MSPVAPVVRRTGQETDVMPSFTPVVRRAIATLVVALAASAALAAQKVNTSLTGLAIDGYDPVAYFTEHKPIKGRPEFTHDHGGATYRFASAANRDLFVKDPQKYAPQYGAFCAYAVSRGYTADTDPLAWKIVGGRLYLNYNGDVQTKWEEDIAGNIEKGNANWPALGRK